MKQIQEWLGHSDFSTTANIYAHLDYSSKLSSAEAMVQGLHLGGSNSPKLAENEPIQERTGTNQERTEAKT